MSVRELITRILLKINVEPTPELIQEILDKGLCIEDLYDMFGKKYKDNK